MLIEGAGGSLPSHTAALLSPNTQHMNTVSICKINAQIFHLNIVADVDNVRMICTNLPILSYCVSEVPFFFHLFPKLLKLLCTDSAHLRYVWHYMGTSYDYRIFTFYQLNVCLSNQDHISHANKHVHLHDGARQTVDSVLT